MTNYDKDALLIHLQHKLAVMTEVGNKLSFALDNHAHRDDLGVLREWENLFDDGLDDASVKFYEEMIAAGSKLHGIVGGHMVRTPAMDTALAQWTALLDRVSSRVAQALCEQHDHKAPDGTFKRLDTAPPRCARCSKVLG